jgi:hypothetical protein
VRTYPQRKKEKKEDQSCTAALKNTHKPRHNFPVLLLLLPGHAGAVLHNTKHEGRTHKKEGKEENEHKEEEEARVIEAAAAALFFSENKQK